MTKKRNGTKTSAFGTSARVNHDSTKFYNSRLYKELGAENGECPQPENPLPADLENRIFLAGAEDMSALPDCSVHLMITSPPYNVSKEYDADLSLDEYLAMLEKVFRETYRVLVHGGRACVNVANLGRKPYLPLSDFISRIMLEIGFKMRGEIIWDKGASASVGTAWGSWKSASNPILRDVHEYVLIFSKGDFTRSLTKHEQAVKKSTIERDEFLEWTKTVWRMSAESARRVGHPAPFPVELPHRLMQLYSFETDVILDPFMGSGTTAVAAAKNGRRFVGFEINEEYVRLSERRLHALR